MGCMMELIKSYNIINTIKFAQWDPTIEFARKICIIKRMIESPQLNLTIVSHNRILITELYN